MNSPLISVVILVYNTEEYLTECLDSVISISENLKYIEIIVVNDASLGNCSEIVEKYKLSYENIELIVHKRNKGRYQARLSGIKMARGKYIMHLDSDDYLCGNILNKLIKNIEKSNADIIFFELMITDGVKEIDFDDWYIIPETEIRGKDNIIKYFLNAGNHTLCSKLYKKSTVDLAMTHLKNIENINSWEDLLQNIIISNFCELTESLHKIGYCYRYNDVSNTKLIRKSEEDKNSVMNEARAVLKAIDNFLLQYNLYENYCIYIAKTVKGILSHSHRMCGFNNFLNEDYMLQTEYCKKVIPHSMSNNISFSYILGNKASKVFNGNNKEKKFLFIITPRRVYLTIFGIKITIKRLYKR